MSQANKYFAGLDIGGSTVKAALVDANGASTGALVEVKSRVKEGYKTTFEQLQEALRQLAEKANIEVSAISGAGMDVPAPNCEGVVWTRANLGDDWVGTNVRDELSELLGIPVYMTNDGNAAALGEYAVRPDYSGGLLLVAPGTGLGGGLVLLGGKIYAGANGLALEVGHISVPHREENGELPECSCGLKGCAEAWVSLMALRRRVSIEVAKDEWKDHPLASDEISVIEKAFQLRDYAEKDDPLAVQIFQQQGQILGYALADLVRVFDPGKVVIGGGLADTSENFRNRYMGWIQEGFIERAWPVYRNSPIEPEKVTTSFEWAAGGDFSAALGMGFVAKDLFGE
ncbi:MAG: ROK family protein [Opitutae bacterium]